MTSIKEVITRYYYLKSFTSALYAASQISRCLLNPGAPDPIEIFIITNGFYF